MAQYVLIPVISILSCQIPVLANESDYTTLVKVHWYLLLSAAQNLAVRADSSPPKKGFLIADGIVCVLGFALCLPGGAILARYLRTSRPWYTGHWIAQFGIGACLDWTPFP